MLAWKLGAAYRDPMGKVGLVSAGGGTSKTPAGTTATFDVVSGHRDAGNTACPGQTTYDRMPQIREMVKADLGAGFTAPAVNQTTFRQSSRGPITLSAGTVGAVDWAATITDGAGAELASSRGSGDEVALSWDLTQPDGRSVPAGRYALRLSGADGDDAALAYTAEVVVRGVVCRGTPKQRALCRASQRAGG